MHVVEALGSLDFTAEEALWPYAHLLSREEEARKIAALLPAESAPNRSQRRQRQRKRAGYTR